jgi:hypothetical protein
LRGQQLGLLGLLPDNLLSLRLLLPGNLFGLGPGLRLLLLLLLDRSLLGQLLLPGLLSLQGFALRFGSALRFGEPGLLGGSLLGQLIRLCLACRCLRGRLLLGFLLLVAG